MEENKTLIAVVVAVVVIAAVAVGAYIWMRSPAEPEPSPPVSVDSIVNITWQWSQLTETEPAAQSVVPDPENYTLVFWPEGQYEVKADCNLGSGSYTVDGSELTLGVMAMTMAECAPESLHDLYVGLLGNVASFGMDGDRLVLYLKDDAGHMVFVNGGPAEPEAPPPPPISVDSIVDITWQWSQLTETEPAAQSVVPDPENYTLVFWTDGRYEVKADCNLGSGSYTVDGSELTLGVMAMTMAECAPESLHDLYVRLLGNVGSFGMDGDRLVLYLKDDAGHMVFANGGPAVPMPTPPPDATPPATAQPPEPVISHPAEGLVGEAVTFDGSESQPGSSPIANYKWDFGDGDSGDGATVNHTYDRPGTFRVTLMVTGEDGLNSVGGPVEITITEAETPTPEPTSTESPQPTSTAAPEPTATSPAAGLVGPTWHWIALIEVSPPAQSAVPDPENYTIKFDEDGTFELQADCNSGTGSYTVNGDGITLVLQVSTSVECGEGSQSDRYVVLLGSAETYGFEDVRLLLYLADNAGRMVFVP